MWADIRAGLHSPKSNSDSASTVFPSVTVVETFLLQANDLIVIRVRSWAGSVTRQSLAGSYS